MVITTIIAAISTPASQAMAYSRAVYAFEIGVRARFPSLRQRARREKLDDLLVVFQAAGLLHALLHALEARRARALDEALRRLRRLRDRLETAFPELRFLFLPELLQRLQALGLVADRDLLQDLARLRRERVPLLHVDEDVQVGREELRQDAELEVAIPVEIHEADLRPGAHFDRAALERRIEVGRVHVDDLGTEVIREERVVDRVAAHLETLDVDVPVRIELRLLRRPEVEADAAIDPAEVVYADALLMDLVQELHAAVLAR